MNEVIKGIKERLDKGEEVWVRFPCSFDIKDFKLK